MNKLLVTAAIIAVILTTAAEAKTTAYIPLTAAAAARIDAAHPIPAEFDPGRYTITLKSGRGFLVTLANGKEVVVHTLPHNWIREACGSAKVYGCEWSAASDRRGSIYDQIVIDNAVPASMFNAVLRHELAHALGWKH